MSQVHEIERQNEKLKQVSIANFQPSASLYSDCLKSYVTRVIYCVHNFTVWLNFCYLSLKPKLVRNVKWHRSLVLNSV